MGHTTGIVFDLTFKSDTPQSILDLFEFLAGCPDYRHLSDSERNFGILLTRCPETFTSAMTQTIPTSKTGTLVGFSTVISNHRWTTSIWLKQAYTKRLTEVIDV